MTAPAPTGHIATRKQFARNLASGWVVLAAEVGVAFLLTPFIIHKLGAAAYGVWALILSVVGTMGLIDIGIRGSVGRYVNHYMALKDGKALSEVVGTANVVLSALALLALAASFAIAANFTLIFPKTPPELAGAIRFCLPLLVVAMWLSFITSILGNLLAAREALYLTNQFAIYTLALRTAMTVWALHAGMGIEALVLVTVGTTVVGLGIVVWAVRRVFGSEMPRVTGFSLPRLQEIWRFGVASFAARTASTLASDSAPLIGMWLLGPEAVAVYSVALTLSQYTRRISEQANAAIFPSVMKAGAMKDMAGLRMLHIRFMDISFAIGSLVFIGLAVFGQSFLLLWVGPTYAQGGTVLVVLALGYLLQGIAGIAPLALASLDKVALTVRVALAEAAACVLLTAALPGLFGLGLLGLALGTTLPRIVTSTIVYPWLGLRAMGAELRRPMLRAAATNLALCAGVAVVFGAVWWLLPPDNWPRLVAAVALITLLHLGLMASRMQGLPIVGDLQARCKRVWLRLASPR